MRTAWLMMLCAATAATTTTPAAAQEQLTRPEGWVTRFDRPGPADSAVWLVSMPPGWHVRTGPAGIHYNPSHTASGNFRIESETHLFPDTRAREAFGILFGGRDLAGDAQAYSYFLIRGDGQFLVKRRDGAQTSTLVNWTAHEAILPRADGAQPKNVLAVEAGPQTVDFYVNGAKMASVPRADLHVDGIVGLRVNHAIDIHVTSLAVTKK